MRAVVQRVSRAAVRVDGAVIGEIGRGLLVLLGVGREDAAADADALADKIANLRVFDDAAGQMNLSALRRRRRRCWWSRSSRSVRRRAPRPPPELHRRRPAGGRASELYRRFVARVAAAGLPWPRASSARRWRSSS